MIFRTFSTDAAKCQQLPLQSPFSFRRLAPAVDYLGSPFSAFFRPLLLGFPLPAFVFRFLFLPLGLRILSSAFTLLPVTQHPVLPFRSLPGSPHSGSPVLPQFFRPSGLSPSVPAWFPIRSFQFCVLSFPVLFPFVLPSLAPAAVPLVLILPSTFRLPLGCSLMPSVPFRSRPV